ncbi:MAG: SelB C-terminal domain-containing protein [bacterium]|nr:SelB C-terminal domain-containing protein [bacterium]
MGIPASTILPPLQQRIGTTLTDQLVSDLLCEQVIESDRGYFRTMDFVPVLSQTDSEKVDRLKQRLTSDGLSPTAPVTLSEELSIPEKELHRLIELLRERGEVTVLEGRLWFLTGQIQVAFEQVLQKLKEQETMSAAEIAVVLNTSRKSAIAIVEEMDRRNLTERIGDVRRLKIK